MAGQISLQSEASEPALGTVAGITAVQQMLPCQGCIVSGEETN